MPSGLAFYNRNNRKDSYQATVNNIGMKHRRIRMEPDNQFSGKSMAKIARKTAAAPSTF